MLTFHQNFLTKEECQELITLIDNNNQRSAVVGTGTDTTTVSEHRTSHTSNLPDNDLVVKIKTKIAETLGYPIEKGEPLQGQVYAPGQYFKSHTDYFENDAYDKHCLSSGNRTHTFMIYLNEVEEGGETNFSAIDESVAPVEGMALSWPNMKDGQVIPEALHEGSEVKVGKKYIITSWWRENAFNGGEDLRLYNEKINSMKNSSTFNLTNIPKLTEKGFKVVKVPDHVWSMVQKAYQDVQDKNADEEFQGKDYFIPGPGMTSTIMSLDYIPEQREEIINALLPIHEEFAGVPLEPMYLYGIRSYNRGATLTMHTDRPETHHISCIIVVDKDLACGCKNKPEADDWALDIKNHQGEIEQVYANVGEMILYESLACEHGRTNPYAGTYFRNMFVHYKFKDLVYKP